MRHLFGSESIRAPMLLHTSFPMCCIPSFKTCPSREEHQNLNTFQHRHLNYFQDTMLNKVQLSMQTDDVEHLCHTLSGTLWCMREVILVLLQLLFRDTTDTSSLWIPAKEIVRMHYSPSSQLLPVQEWASNLQQTVETVFQSHPSPLQSVEWLQKTIS